MFVYILRRIVYVIPIVVSVALVCFLLVHITPGDPLVAILPADASQELANQLRIAYGFDRPLPVQFGLWLWKAVNGDLGHSIATGRPVLAEVMRAVGNTVTLAIAAALIGFTLGTVLWPDRRLFPRYLDRQGGDLDCDRGGLGAALLARHGAGDHLLGATQLAARGRRRSRRFRRVGMGLGTHPLSDPARGHHVGDSDGHRHAHGAGADRRYPEPDFVEALRAKGLRETHVFRHVIKNAAPTAMAVMGLQLGYMLGGSILIETVFSWPGSGLLLNSAIFQRDLPLLQGTILVLALFFVFLNLLVDIAQASIDPRIKRS